jgi:hypothetical protein
MNVTYGMQSIEEKGSRFWMRFQQHQGESKALDPTPLTPSYRLPAASLRGSCLVVDDDPLVTSAWESLMSSWGIVAAPPPPKRLLLLSTGIYPKRRAVRSAIALG